jgi:hypothetical protein
MAGGEAENENQDLVSDEEQPRLVVGDSLCAWLCIFSGK